MRGGNVDYVKQAQREQKHIMGGAHQLKGLMAEIKTERKQEGELLKRYGQPSNQKQEKKDYTQGGTTESSAAFLNTTERDREMLQSGLQQAQKAKAKKQPKIDKKNPLYQKYFFENISVAERVKHLQVSIDRKGQGGGAAADSYSNVDKKEDIVPWQRENVSEERKLSRQDSQPSSYSILTSKTGDRDHAAINISNGHWQADGTGTFPHGNLRKLAQTEEDQEMETKWKSYLQKKKQQKEQRKYDDLMNVNLTNL